MKTLNLSYEANLSAIFNMPWTLNTFQNFRTRVIYVILKIKVDHTPKAECNHVLAIFSDQVTGHERKAKAKDSHWLP